MNGLRPDRYAGVAVSNRLETHAGEVERRRCVGMPGFFGRGRSCGRAVPRRNTFRCGPCDREIERRQQVMRATLYPRRHEVAR
jgi:hypothetical protein